MPFRSQKQARWMFSQKPEMAQEWASQTPSIKALPQTVTQHSMGHPMAPLSPEDHFAQRFPKLMGALRGLRQKNNL
jgi:hypothetical protein